MARATWWPGWAPPEVSPGKFSRQKPSSMGLTSTIGESLITGEAIVDLFQVVDLSNRGHTQPSVASVVAVHGDKAKDTDGVVDAGKQTPEPHQQDPGGAPEGGVGGDCRDQIEGEILQAYPRRLRRIRAAVQAARVTNHLARFIPDISGYMLTILK